VKERESDKLDKWSTDRKMHRRKRGSDAKARQVSADEMQRRKKGQLEGARARKEKLQECMGK
jgi:hypothetical protein